MFRDHEAKCGSPMRSPSSGQPGAGSLLLCGFNEVLPEKSNNIRVKPPMEVNAIEARRIGANGRSRLCFFRGAGREEGIVFGVFHEMVVGLCRKPLIDSCRTAPG